MKGWLFVVVFLVLSLGVVSAYGVYWNMDGGEVLSYEKFSRVDFDDKYDRYNRVVRVRDFDDVHKRSWEWRKDGREWKRKDLGNDWRMRDLGSWRWEARKDYYYNWVPYLRAYERVECYHSAPRGKLIYRKCP